jgi:hypothetical protein
LRTVVAPSGAPFCSAPLAAPFSAGGVAPRSAALCAEVVAAAVIGAAVIGTAASLRAGGSSARACWYKMAHKTVKNAAVTRIELLLPGVMPQL